MTDLLNLLFNPLPNGIMTILTGISLLYWLFVLISGDGIDFGTDMDVDIDPDGIGDINDGEAPSAHEAPGFFSKALEFISIGKAPLMVIITLFKFIGWILTITSSLFISVGQLGYWSVLILVPIFIITYFLMHWITKPIAKFYSEIGYQGEESHDYLGRNGVMKSSISGDKIGSVEIIINKDVIRLNVQSSDGTEINYNDDVVVVDDNEERKIYLVKKEINIHNIK